MLGPNLLVGLSLVGVVLSRAAEYVPLQKRHSYSSNYNDFSYLGMLSKRDACSDAFGPTAQNSNCAPDLTLCCTRSGQAYPSCQQYLQRGWCCVGSSATDDCYLDSASMCDLDGAVPCTRLANGTTEACCFKDTTCDPNLDASEGLVRCNINQGVLIASDSASIASTATTSRSSSTSTTTSKTSTTTTTASTTTTKTNQSNPISTGPAPTSDTTSDKAKDGGNSKSGGGISGGTIAGIVIGALAGVAIFAALLWFLFRKRKTSGAAQQTEPAVAYTGEQSKQLEQSQQLLKGSYYGPEGYGQEPSELHSDPRAHEMYAGAHPQELDAQANGVQS